MAAISEMKILLQIFNSSSRTDAGVHAITNTTHFDFTSCDKDFTLDPLVVTRSMNKVLHDYDEHSYVRILKTRLVPSTFHCRYHAKGRSYVYRLSVLKPGVDQSSCKFSCYDSLLPVVERCRCYIVRSPFDVGIFQAAVELFNGEHDFATFMSSPNKCKENIRTVLSMEASVSPGRPFMDPSYDPLYDNLDLLDVHFDARFFLYKQIRRMIGAAVGAAQGVITMSELRFMLDNPSQGNWNVRLRHGSPDGLYLREIEYDETDFVLPVVDGGGGGGNDNSN